MKKAKTYRLLCNTLRVEYRDKVVNENGDWIFGEVVNCGGRSIISISTKDRDGVDIPEDELDITLRHELFHFILDSLYFTELSQNETLVEWLANATAELNKQGLSI